MTKRKRAAGARRRATRSSKIMYGTAGDLMQAGLQMAELFTSSMQVIERRNDMLVKAMTGEIPADSKEFTDMWQEKLIAGGESMRIAMGLLARSNPYGVTLADWMKVVTPYRKKASSNARRLNKAKKP